MDGQAHIYGMESFWALMMKRGCHSTNHRMSPAHLQRSVNEFGGRHSQRTLDTEVQMRIMAQGAGREAAALQRLGRGAQAQRHATEPSLPEPGISLIPYLQIV